MEGPKLRRQTSRLERLKRIGRAVGLNTVYKNFWRQPMIDLASLMRDGGPLERRKTEAGHTAMMEAAKTLPTLALPALDRGVSVHLLTGERFWHQSTYCVASLQIALQEKVMPTFYSDGTLSGTIQDQVRRVLPAAQFVDSAAIEAQLEDILPASRFPALRSRRNTYLHLRKLTDIHIFSNSWRLVLDSDLLFFRRPAQISEWFGAPRPMYLTDIVSNYGYPLDYLGALAGATLPEKLNVGLYGLDSGAIDWDRVEHWCAHQLASFLASYLQEQGLTAMLFAGKTAEALPAQDYIVMPNLREGRAPRAIMHHYVDHSKRSYFQYGWREIDRRIRNAASPKNAYAL